MAAKTHILRVKPPWQQDGNRTRCGRRAESRMAAIWPDAEMAAMARPYWQWRAIIRSGNRHLAPPQIRDTFPGTPAGLCVLHHRLTRTEFPALVACQLDGRLRELAAGKDRLTPVRRQILGDIDRALARADWPLPNVMLGVSAEDRGWWCRRVPYLVKTPAAARMVSIEPLLHQVGPVDLADVHWVIAGGESGPAQRPTDLDWVRELRDQCLDQGVAFWFKQVGGAYPRQRGDMLDGRHWKQHYEGMSP